MPVVGHRGVDLTATPHALQAQFAHQPPDRATGDAVAVTMQLTPDLTGSVDVMVGGMEPVDLGLEPPVTDWACPVPRTPPDLS